MSVNNIVLKIINNNNNESYEPLIEWILIVKMTYTSKSISFFM